jgi:predicted nuclease of predicted toxin-antitoxin system
LKLLFDENLSFRLALRLASAFPESKHVRELGLSRSSDDDVWNFAATHGFCIVSKDEDFQQRSFLRGHPPKVVWVRMGNCSTREIERLLLDHAKDLIEFDAHKDASFLALS